MLINIRVMVTRATIAPLTFLLLVYLLFSLKTPFFLVAWKLKHLYRYKAPLSIAGSFMGILYVQHGAVRLTTHTFTFSRVYSVKLF